MTRKNVYTLLLRAVRSIWLFPAVLILVMLVLTGLKISGTSVGIYQQLLGGNLHDNESRLAFEPRGVRSDEWLVNTQVVIAQVENGFPYINQNFGSGQNMSVIVDVPYIEWSAIFKPQNFSFFILPLEHAFAFKWWFLLVALTITCYLFCLRILHGRKLLSIIMSLCVAMSPFIGWWYQTITIMPMVYGFLMLLLGMRIVDGKKFPFVKKDILSKILYVTSIIYILTSFALVLYPPFQISIALAVAAFLIGYIIQKCVDTKKYKVIFTRLGLVAAGLAGSLAIVTIFILTRLEVVKLISNTSHPGTRIIPSGDSNPLSLVDSFLMPLIKDGGRAVNFYNNQSEVSSFILLLPFLLVPGFFLLVYIYRKYRKIDFVLLILQLVSLFILARMFIPLESTVYHLFFLHKVPNERLMLALGMVGVLQMLWLMVSLKKVQLSNKLMLILSSLYGLSCFIFLMAVAYYTSVHYPDFVQDSWIKVTLLALSFSALIVLILARKWMAFAIAFFCLSFYSWYNINPIYTGLSPLTKNEITSAIKDVSKPGDTWITVDNINLENFAVMANRHSVGGTQIYPDLKLWNSVVGEEHKSIYNRYSHAYFSSKQTKDIELVQKNVFSIKFACNEFITTEVDYVLSAEKLYYPCTDPIKTIRYGKADFYIYRIAGS